MKNNTTAFSTFRKQLANQNKLQNGNEAFLGYVIYNFNGQKLKEALFVTLQLTKIEYGKVSIEEGEILNSEIVHMDFDSNLQDYSYNNFGFLIIKGNSSKIGKYEVKITQI